MLRSCEMCIRDRATEIKIVAEHILKTKQKLNEILAAEDPGKDVQLYINSPGGSVTAGMAIYDTMQYIKCCLLYTSRCV